MLGTKLRIGIVGVAPTKVVNLDIYIVDQLAGLQSYNGSPGVSGCMMEGFVFVPESILYPFGPIDLFH